ncbi:sensor histidine kinase [Microvirga lotononidis]|uniref:Blue-light-activated histidine kinase n=1 Tax=Microvirga lotononidis TaxID=864069 RepID=I4YPG9_9HYPH|nr:HWE histidine kinase domain-containing protein [Microvirga lotononidis]EIM25861.1 PAS domain S-box [Microvirga lotononidis]WQO25781.1 HWE histidine kinase domain-containing protein [Microvirga lotononidis]
MLIRFTTLSPLSWTAASLHAVGAVGVAMIARYALDPLLGDELPYITLYPAVLFTAIVAGGWTGMGALLLGVAATFWFLSVSPGPAPFSAQTLTGLIIYLFGGAFSVVAASSLRSAAARLEVAQERLLATLEASGAGTWRWDFRANAVDWDPALARLFGLEPAQAPRQRGDFRRYVHPDDQEHIGRSIDGAIESGSTVDYEFRAILADGSLRWMYTRSRLLRDTKGGPALMVGACLDITERKRAQEQQMLLVQELNHRVTNTLSVVQSLAHHTRRGSRDLDGFQETFLARLMALSATHNILTRELWESASLEDILHAEMIPYGGLDKGRVTMAGEPIRLKPQQALGFGLALHELATNAAKYGALSIPHGRLDISWRAEMDEDGRRRLSLDWVEQGGPMVEPPKRLGFGSRLIERSIRDELGGGLDLRFQPDGLRCSLSLPL